MASLCCYPGPTQSSGLDAIRTGLPFVRADLGPALTTTMEWSSRRPQTLSWSPSSVNEWPGL